jgi:hypothetical protein
MNIEAPAPLEKCSFYIYKTNGTNKLTISLIIYTKKYIFKGDIYMKKILLALVLTITIIFTNSLAFAEEIKGSQEAEVKFTDISNHWAEESINKVVNKADFAGIDGKFLPDKAITRSEFVLMLHKALGINIAYFKATDIREFYDDVKNEDKYASALYDLATLNIIDIKEHFYPNNTMPREEMVHYIMNAYKYKIGENYKMIKLVVNPFADDKEINPSYSGEVARAEYMGILKRPTNNRFYPKNDSTRAQAATVIDRLLNQLEKENLQVLVTPTVEMKDGSLKMKLTITNDSKTQIIINHSSGQKFDFKLLDSNRDILYTWSADKLFIMALTETVIEPGESVEFSEVIEKELLDSMNGKAVYMKAYIVGESSGFVVNNDGYETEIK